MNHLSHFLVVDLSLKILLCSFVLGQDSRPYMKSSPGAFAVNNLHTVEISGHL